jgi:hypothetical protein
MVENDRGPLDVRDVALERALHDQADADGRGQVIHDVALVNELVHDRTREHGLDDEMEAWMLSEVGDVVAGPGREIVEAEDLVAVLYEQLAQV